MEGISDSSQPVVEDEVLTEEEVEGYQSALDCTACKKSLPKMETTNRELTPQNRIDMYCYIKNDEENIFEGKGKGGKG